MLQSMGSQRIGHNLATEQEQRKERETEKQREGETEISCSELLSEIRELVKSIFLHIPCSSCTTDMASHCFPRPSPRGACPLPPGALLQPWRASHLKGRSRCQRSRGSRLSSSGRRTLLAQFKQRGSGSYSLPGSILPPLHGVGGRESGSVRRQVKGGCSDGSNLPCP